MAFYSPIGSGLLRTPETARPALPLSIGLTHRPRILMVSGEAPPLFGGIGASTYQLMLEMAELRPGWRWLWISRRPRWYSSPVTRLGPITLLRPAFGWGGRNGAFAEYMARICRPDLVHVQDEEYSYHHTDAPCRIASATTAPLVSTLHEYHPDGPGTAHTAELARRSEVVITNDSRTAQRCLDLAGREPDHVLWSANTIRPPAPGQAPPRQAGQIATFGFINRLKRLDTVYGGMGLLRDRHPELNWKIMGPFDPEHDAGHAALSRELSGDWVSFTGGLEEDDLRQRLSASRMMVLPFSDGASMRRGTLQVAWAFGLPVITTAPQSHEPMIVDGRNCLLVRDSTPEAWAEAIGRLMSDPELELRLREGSLATARELSVARQAAMHVEIYESLLQRSEREPRSRRAAPLAGVDAPSSAYEGAR